MRYQMEWDGGPKAIIDLRCVKDDTLMLRYDGPLQPTLRRGVVALEVTNSDLTARVSRIRRLAASSGLSGPRGAAPAAPPSDAWMELAKEGRKLLTLVLSDAVAVELGSASQLFIDIGTDEALVPEPWELMCDDKGFICLRHAVGRYVNLDKPPDLSSKLDQQGDLRVLLISVPNPHPSNGVVYERLPEVEAEFDAMTALLVDRGIDFHVLQGKDATEDHVVDALHGEVRYTIVHFSGHGHVDVEDPRRSGLVLHDGIVTTSGLAPFLKHPPILAFINGCETTKTVPAAAPEAGEEPHLPQAHLTRVFGIARPFLDKGSYVLGTRWRVSDTAAAAFALEFYEQVFDGKPIGEAIMNGRRRVYDASSSDLSWASYVFYGDPRLMIELEGDEAPAPEPEVPAGPPPADPTPATAPALGPPDVPAAPEAAPEPETPLSPGAAVERLLDEAAADYDTIRQGQSRGTRRTLEMERLLDGVRALAPEVDPDAIASRLQSDDEGTRIVGVALSEKAPRPSFLTMLLQCAAQPKSNFEEYHAFRALREVADDLQTDDAKKVQEFLRGRLSDENFLATDRAFVARELLARLDRRIAELDVENDATGGKTGK